MNIYDDYIKYIEENNYLIKLLENNVPAIYVLFEDVLVVLNYIVEEYQKGSQLNEDLKDFFDAGYGYLTSVMTDLKMIFDDYFKKDVILLTKYGNLITYFFYIEDLKCHLDAEELLTKSKQKTIDDIQQEIETILVNKLEPSDDLTDKYELKISKITSAKDNYHPIYTIFALIREELNLF